MAGCEGHTESEAQRRCRRVKWSHQRSRRPDCTGCKGPGVGHRTVVTRETRGRPATSTIISVLAGFRFRADFLAWILKSLQRSARLKHRDAGSGEIGCAPTAGGEDPVRE